LTGFNVPSIFVQLYRDRHGGLWAVRESAASCAEEVIET
jgi:hypothetical protein